MSAETTNKPPMSAREAFAILTDRARRIRLDQEAEEKEQERIRAEQRAQYCARLEEALREVESDPERVARLGEWCARLRAYLDENAKGWRGRRRLRAAEERREQRRADDAARPAPRFESIVHVPLIGRHGEGRSFVMDAADWRVISAACGDRWSITRTARATAESVTAISTQAVEGARKLGFAFGKTPIVNLARLIAGASPWDEVRFVDGDRLNLRADNLMLCEREAVRAFERMVTADKRVAAES